VKRSLLLYTYLKAFQILDQSQAGEGLTWKQAMRMGRSARLTAQGGEERLCAEQISREEKQHISQAQCLPQMSQTHY